MTHDLDLLQAARIGYQHQLAEVEARIAELTSKAEPRKLPDLGMLRGAVGRPTKQPTPQKKRKMSAAGRKRISEATKKRWAELREKKNKTGSAAA